VSNNITFTSNEYKWVNVNMSMKGRLSLAYS